MNLKLLSLPKKFQTKVTTTEESKVVDVIEVMELVGSLQNYEMILSKSH